MAEEVEISNVGAPDGVASEATLANLLKAVDKMARQTGKDPKSEQAKVLKTHTKAISATTLESRKYRDALEDKTEATEEAAQATRSFSRSMQGALVGAIGSVVGSLKGISGELLSGSDRVSEFSQHIPILGGMISAFTGIMDETFDAYRTLAMSGAAFGNDLNELRRASAEAYMSLDQFTSFVKENNDIFSMYSGTVTQGISHFRELNSEFDQHREQLMNMGFTYEDINDTLTHYMFLSRAGAIAQQRSTEEQAEAAADYARNLSTLSKLTGEDVKTMQDKIAQEQSNIAWQSKMAQMDEEQADRVRRTHATILQTQGEAAAEYFKQQILGMPPLTEQTQMFASVMSEAASNVREMADVTRQNIDSNEDFWQAQDKLLVESIANMATTNQEFETIVAAGAAGVGGAAGTLFEVLNSTGVNIASFYDEELGFREDLLMQALQDAREESAASSNTVESMTSFDRAMKSIYQSLRIGFVDSGILDTFANGLEQVADFLNSEEFQASLDNMIDNVAGKFSNFVDTMGDPEGGIVAAIKGLFTDEIDLTDTVVDFVSLVGAGLFEAFTGSTFAKYLGLAVVGAFGAKIVADTIASSLGSAIGGMGGAAARTTTGGIAGRAAGTAGRGLGRGAEGLISGVGRGFQKVGMAAPKVAAGGAALGVAIAAVGAAFAGAMFLMERTLGPFAEGIRSFEDLDGERLSQAGSGMSRLAAGIAAMGASDVVSSWGNLIGGASDWLSDFLFGAESPMETVKRFAEYDIDISRVEKNANALLVFNEMFARATEASPGIADNLRSSISEFFAEGDPLARISEFTRENIDVGRVKNNARALVEFNKSLAEAAQVGNQSSIARNIMDSIAGVFRSDDDIENLKRFGELDINAAQVIENADAISYFANTISGLSVSELNELNISRGTIISFERMSRMGIGLDTTADALERLSSIEGIDKNITSINASLDAGSVRNYTSAIDDLVSALEDLNAELREDNTGWFGRGSDRTSAGEVIQQVNSSNQASNENTAKLVSLLENMLAVLSDNSETHQRIERNTRRLRSSGNLANGVSG